MDAIRVYREQLAKLNAKFLSISQIKSRGFAIQFSDLDEEKILALPEVVISPIQNLDASSPDFGKLYFIAGIDDMGDPEHPFYS